MHSISREMASRRSTPELNLVLKGLFNKLAERDLDPAECNCCHASVQVVKAELGRPGRQSVKTARRPPLARLLI